MTEFRKHFTKIFTSSSFSLFLPNLRQGNCAKSRQKATKTAFKHKRNFVKVCACAYNNACIELKAETFLGKEKTFSGFSFLSHIKMVFYRINRNF